MKMDFLLEYTPMAGLSGEERVTEIILCWTLMKVRDISLVILHPGSVDKAGHLYLVVLEAVHHWSVSIRVLDVPEAVHSPVSTVYLQTSLSVLLDSNLGVPPSPPAPRRTSPGLHQQDGLVGVPGPDEGSRVNSGIRVLSPKILPGNKGRLALSTD